MTRLVEADIESLAERLAKYDEYLRKVCGRGLAEIARIAARRDDAPARRVAVIPITSGLGVIGGFCETVAAIVEFLGHSAVVTGETDLAGVASAARGGYDVIMAADDDTFIAVNLKKQLVSDNSEATGRAFATALSLAAGGLERKNVLLIGAGPVGRAAAEAMLGLGAALTVYDIDPERAAALRRARPSVGVAESLEPALRDHSLILEATPAGAFIREESLRRDAILSAPGVPLCLDFDGAARMRGRLLHDVLELGVAAMLFDVL
jgi:pyrrolysine biosynthesis protein PylD